LVIVHSSALPLLRGSVLPGAVAVAAIVEEEFQTV
jgi:hypothetical protein